MSTCRAVITLSVRIFRRTNTITQISTHWVDFWTSKGRIWAVLVAKSRQQYRRKNRKEREEKGRVKEVNRWFLGVWGTVQPRRVDWGEVYTTLKGDTLLATSSGICFLLGSPRSPLFSMPSFTSIFHRTRYKDQDTEPNYPTSPRSAQNGIRNQWVLTVSALRFASFVMQSPGPLFHTFCKFGTVGGPYCLYLFMFCCIPFSNRTCFVAACFSDVFWIYGPSILRMLYIPKVEPTVF